MEDDLKAVSYGHAVSALGYEVRLGKGDLTWRDGKHAVRWEFKKQKDGKLLLLRSTREIKKHKHEAEGGQELGERELQMIDQLVEKAIKVLRLNAAWK
jgi:hypothetical protein